MGSDGVLGVKTLDGDDKVVLNAVEIIRAQTDGIWVSGLPETARIISIGQGFVSQGETVNPHADMRADQNAADVPQLQGADHE